MSDEGRNGGRQKAQDDEGDDQGMSSFARAWVEAAPYLGIGWAFVTSMGLFGVLGWWLDGKLGTGRLCLVAGLLLGMVLGFFSFFKVVLDKGRRKS